MQDDFLELESLVLEGVTLNSLADSIDASVQVTGLRDVEAIELEGFDAVTSSELFDPSMLPNKIEIFEGDESYAFVAMTQAIQPTVQPFTDVADLAIKEVRNEKANLLINDFAKDAEGIIDGENALPNLNAFSQESYKACLLYTSPSPRDRTRSRMPSSA